MKSRKKNCRQPPVSFPSGLGWLEPTWSGWNRWLCYYHPSQTHSLILILECGARGGCRVVQVYDQHLSRELTAHDVDAVNAAWSWKLGQSGK